MVEETVFEKRKKKFFSWLNDPYNQALALLILFAFAVRIYIFWLTKDQAVWWDEAEYAVKSVSFIEGNPSMSTGLVRELGMPVLWALFYLISPNEVLWRIGQLLMSTALVYLTYLIGTSIFNRRVGLVAGVMMSTNMLALFYTGRLLLYMWGGFLFALGVWLFYEGYINKKGIKWIYGSAAVLAIGTLIYYSAFLAVALIGLFLIMTSKFSELKSKKIVRPALLGAAILGVYFIFSYIKWGFLHPRLYQGASDLINRTPNFDKWLGHFPLFPHIFGWVWIILLIIGLVMAFRILLILDVIVLKKKSTKEEKGYLFMILWFFFVMIFFAVMAVRADTAVYEGFIMPVFPAVAVLAGVGLVSVYDLLAKNSKVLGLLLVAIIVASTITTLSPAQDMSLKGNLRYSTAVIQSSYWGFYELKVAGQWVKENTQPEEKIYSYSHPQISYYSQRHTTHFRHQFKGENPYEEVTSENLKELLLLNNISYMVLSPYESPPAEILQFPARHPNFTTPVYAVPSRNNPNQPAVIVYKIHPEHA